MDNTGQVDVAILGAGIAGLSLADALLQKNKTCVLIDTQSPGSGASGAPLMLLNPATGRRAKMAWRAGESLPAIHSLLQRVQRHSPDIFYEENGVIRPALTKELAKDFRKAPTKYSWPDTEWIEWLEPDPFTKQYPEIPHHFGGLFVKKGMTVYGELFLTELSKLLVNIGLNIVTNRNYRLNPEQGSWKIIFENGRTISAKKTVYATGAFVTKSAYWKKIPMNIVKGQTATFHFNKPLDLKSSISSLGYLAFITSRPHLLVAGSTYEHHFSDAEPDGSGLEILKKKVNTVFPGMAERAVAVDQWAGFRVSTMDKKPVIGEHPDLKGLYLFSGLGSKGLLLGRYMAQLLADHITTQKPIPREVSVERFLD